MDLLKNIKNNTIIVCENNYKEYILKEMSKALIFLNVKFFTKKEFIINNTFEYDEKALAYLMKKYKYKVDIAKMFLNNLYYIEDKEYESSKLNHLVNLKKELIDNKLLKYNNNFYNVYKDYTILVIDYPLIEPYELNIFNKYNVCYWKEDGNNELDLVYELSSIEDEVSFVFDNICKLIKEGVDINNIKITGVNEEYCPIIERMAFLYNLPINRLNKICLYGNEVANIFLSNLKNGINAALESIQNKSSEIVNIIIRIYNKYSFCDDYNILKELLISEFKNTSIKNDKYQNYLEITNINSLFSENDYVFYLNFNNGFTPLIEKDEEYITDNIKDEIGLLKTLDINCINKNYFLNKLKSIKHLFITYKKYDSNGECYASSLIEDLNLRIIIPNINDVNKYSYLNELIKYVKVLDKYTLYGIYDDNYDLYHNTFNNIKYKSYDNSYNEIDVSMLKKYLNNKLTLSYTSLNTYNKCAFKYYIDNILKLNVFEDSFEALEGSLVHYALERFISNGANPKDAINMYLKNNSRDLTKKEKFFVNKLIKNLEIVINEIDNQKTYSSLNNCYLEKNIIVDKSRDINIYFVGVVDKILYKHFEKQDIVAIIDYKTGFVDTDLKYLPYGLNMQLPIYLYLVKNSNLFNNICFAGFYIQYILNKEIVKDNKHNIEYQIKDSLKLVGYSNSDKDILSKFDASFNNSELIKGLKTKKDGEFSYYSKVLNNEDIKKIIELTEDVINKTIDDIMNANFKINPKKIGYDKEVGCEYCKYKDLCYKRDENYIVLKEINNINYLGGEDDVKTEVD